jgi:WhiB family redox-sensing transcriptional regulator
MSRNWRVDALCAHEDPELFFPVGTKGPSREQVARAKAVCNRCPVQQDCRKDSLNETHGVWAGEDRESERQGRKVSVRGRR